jgi:peptidoglycan-associated lipoprotein
MKSLFEKAVHMGLLGVLTLGLTGCPPKKKKSVPVDAGVPASDELASGRGDSILRIGSEWERPGVLEPVHFETNQAELSAESRAILKKNAAILKAILEKYPGVQIRAEGHCDQRGTLEYNLALGQRRANAVRDYYRTIGIRSSALKTVSFGEEKGLCFENNEGCWWRNRRTDTTLKSASGTLQIPREQLPE